MPKKCCICKQVFTPRFSTTERCCQNYDCKVEYALQVVSKQRTANEKKRKQEYTKEKIEAKEKLKTLTDWHNDLQKEINSIVRAIDNGHPCISSQRPLGKSFDAGHLFSRGSNPHIRYHLFNIFAQSVHDNQWKSGNQLDFVHGIEKTFGKEIQEYCLSLKSLPGLKLTIPEIKEKIPVARSILKWLKLQQKQFSIEERIELRKKINNELAIYNQ